ncbi:hypothetical protein ABE67_19145 [Cytobacillus firmus]|uniref:glycoside hydrolase family 30 beta sandwich domain-containing protein n=1 Tax=Cytobacillus firmus TaxID=1399 RepID=UPI001F557638|nr:glycoside hydrolase family 30 beta sandwich domain-containing protein [Cytobacillus firmus]MBG9451341.1 hypothetical protein [Cytobacillus firmus]
MSIFTTEGLHRSGSLEPFTNQPGKKGRGHQALFRPRGGTWLPVGSDAHINSCDFSLGNYTYVGERDTSLKSFSIGREKEFVWPLIHDAMKAAGEQLFIVASPWSPPPWVKTAFENINGETVAVLMNGNDREEEVSISLGGNSMMLVLPKHSIATVIIH